MVMITVLISRSFNLGLKIHHPPFNCLGVVRHPITCQLMATDTLLYRMLFSL